MAMIDEKNSRNSIGVSSAVTPAAELNSGACFDACRMSAWRVRIHAPGPCGRGNPGSGTGSDTKTGPASRSTARSASISAAGRVQKSNRIGFGTPTGGTTESTEVTPGT